MFRKCRLLKKEKNNLKIIGLGITLGLLLDLGLFSIEEIRLNKKLVFVRRVHVGRQA